MNQDYYPTYADWKEFYDDPDTDGPHKLLLLADLAQITLGRLARLRGELHPLYHALLILRDYAAAHPDAKDLHAEFLQQTAAELGGLYSFVPELVRDIAVRLPLRGLDYSEDV